MGNCLCTGHYFNFWNDVGSLDLFIIVNEGNYEAVDQMSMQKFNEAIEACDGYIRDKKMTLEECEELEKILDEIFPFGVQVFNKKIK